MKKNIAFNFSKYNRTQNPIRSQKTFQSRIERRKDNNWDKKKCARPWPVRICLVFRRHAHTHKQHRTHQTFSYLSFHSNFFVVAIDGVRHWYIAHAVEQMRAHEKWQTNDLTCDVFREHTQRSNQTLKA